MSNVVIPKETAERNVRAALSFLSDENRDRVMKALFTYPMTGGASFRKSIRVLVQESQSTYKDYKNAER